MVGQPLRRLLLALLCCGLTTAAAAPNGSSPNNDGGVDRVLVWAPSWSRTPPRVPLRGATIGSSTSPGPFAVWENFAEVPRAVELFSGNSGNGGAGSESDAQVPPALPSAFFGDTQGSLFMLEPGVAVHELLPRDPTVTVDNSILSLAYDKHTQQLYYTQNTTLRVMKLSADGTKPNGKRIVADFAPSGVQNLIVDWSTTIGGGDYMAYFCLFDGPNRTAGSLVRAPLSTYSVQSI
jgi:hypothetical protein